RAVAARRTLAARGLIEAITWSFVPAQHAEHFGGGAAALKLANPISSEMSDMRPSLLPGLLAAARANANRGFGDTALFEVGQIFKGPKPDEQIVSASGVRTGTSVFLGSGRHWDGAARSVGAFDAKADALSVLAAIGLDTEKLKIGR